MKTSILPRSQHHLPVFDEDWEYITTHFGKDSSSGMSASEVCMHLIHRGVMNLKQKYIEEIDKKRTREMR